VTTLEIDSPQSPLRLTFPAGRAAIVHCRRGLDAREPSQQKKTGERRDLLKRLDSDKQIQENPRQFLYLALLRLGWVLPDFDQFRTGLDIPGRRCFTGREA
jgi:hypothetical protein